MSVMQADLNCTRSRIIIRIKLLLRLSTGLLKNSDKNFAPANKVLTLSLLVKQ
jgi:hypothetical protein